MKFILESARTRLLQALYLIEDPKDGAVLQIQCALRKIEKALSQLA
jgi:hypothetical protein